MGTIFQQYYTKSNEIVSYMINKLSLKPNSLVLEPCAGDGVFIEALLKKEHDIKIDVFEMNSEEANKLKYKFENKNNIHIKNEDTLLFNDFINGSCDNKYDFIIANPPYGAWQDYEKRETLKNIYPKLYIKETYTTFLFLCISLLKKNGRLVFITPDTYLNLHMHTFLRKFILQNSIIEEIAIFPSKFFPGVNFGYSKMSIITLVKTDNYTEMYNNKIKLIEGLSNPEDLINDKTSKTIMLSQKDMMENDNYALIYSNDNYLKEIIKHSTNRIGDIANCVTGIYTGNDKLYIKVKDHSIKNSKNYEIISRDEVYNEKIKNGLNGLNGNNHYIPIVKGGNKKYLKQNTWFINWNEDAVQFYKLNKKARFQNSQYYFKQGLAVPMVSSNTITASLLNNRIFDQSIVGVFPYDEKYVLYLLAFFNTTICTKLIRMINPSANNSANYIKKIPIIIPDINTVIHIEKMVETILLLKNYDSDTSFIEEELENIFNIIFYKNPVEEILTIQNQQKELFV